MLYIESLMTEDIDNSDVDPSHDLDLVAVFASSNHDAEMEANAIHGLLEANEIPSIVVGARKFRHLNFKCKCPEHGSKKRSV